MPAAQGQEPVWRNLAALRMRGGSRQPAHRAALVLPQIDDGDQQPENTRVFGFVWPTWQNLHATI